MRKKIGEIFQDVFVREVNRLIYVAVFQCRLTITKAFSPFYLEDSNIWTSGTILSTAEGAWRKLETLRYPEIGVRVTGCAMFFPFCGDVIDLTR